MRKKLSYNMYKNLSINLQKVVNSKLIVILVKLLNTFYVELYLKENDETVKKSYIEVFMNKFFLIFSSLENKLDHKLSWN